MSFEQYQFLRYYLPGSLFLLYLGLFLTPFVNYLELQRLLGDNLLSLITLVGGAFVVSPAIGYLLYSAYDTWIYNWQAMDWSNRRTLMCLIEWARIDDQNTRKAKFAEIDKADSAKLEEMRGGLETANINLGMLRPSLKSLIDFILHSKPSNGNSEIHDEQISTNLRGYWSHFNARWVCGIIAPIAALLTIAVLLLLLFPIVIQGPVVFPYWSTPTERWVWFSVEVALVIKLSLCYLIRSRHNPKREAFELEYYAIRTKLAGAGNGFYEEARSYFGHRVRGPAPQGGPGTPQPPSPSEATHPNHIKAAKKRKTSKEQNPANVEGSKSNE